MKMIFKIKFEICHKNIYSSSQKVPTAKKVKKYFGNLQVILKLSNFISGHFSNSPLSLAH